MGADAGARLAYINAASHSGSTLLAMLLNSHGEICTAGELKLSNLNDIETYRCSCLERIRECEFWKAVAAHLQRRGFEFDIQNAGMDLTTGGGSYERRLLKPLLRGAAAEGLRDAALGLSSAWRTGFRRWQRRNLALIEAIAEVSGSHVVVDSSKTGLRAKYLQSINGLDLRLVRLIRDGRAVSLTYIDASNFADATNPGLRGGGSGRSDHRNLSMKEAATEWRRSNEEAEHLERLVGPDKVIRVKYEDLCNYTQDTLDRIVTFLGLQPGYDFHVFRGVSHHVVGNGMRLDSTAEVSLDDRWREVLSDQQLATFEEVAGHMNRRYGYDD